MGQMRNSNLFCEKCGEYHKIGYPIPIQEMVKKITNFDKLHKNCEQTYVPPQIEVNLPIIAKMQWWLQYGERGLSSETMFVKLSGEMIKSICYPIDSDDFRRCYLLLEAIPEWKTEIHKLKSLSKEWNNLVENWTKLTELFENDKYTEVYNLIQKLIK